MVLQNYIEWQDEHDQHRTQLKLIILEQQRILSKWLFQLKLIFTNDSSPRQGHQGMDVEHGDNIDSATVQMFEQLEDQNQNPNIKGSRDSQFVFLLKKNAVMVEVEEVKTQWTEFDTNNQLRTGDLSFYSPKWRFHSENFKSNAYPFALNTQIYEE